MAYTTVDLVWFCSFTQLSRGSRLHITACVVVFSNLRHSSLNDKCLFNCRYLYCSQYFPVNNVHYISTLIIGWDEADSDNLYESDIGWPDVNMRLTQSQSVYLKKTCNYKENTLKWSYSYTCDQEIYWLATLDYGQRWLALNPFPNNKHQVINIHMLHKLWDLQFK